MTSERGFTLIEVLIALAIFAVSLTAAVRVCNVATDTAREFRHRLLAGWVAENRLAEYGLGRAPEVGERAGTAEQGGINFGWRERLSTVEAPFPRIEVQVYLADAPDRILFRAAGYAVRMP